MSIIMPCHNERGAALVIALMFVAILGMLGTTATILTTTDMQIGGNYKTSQQAFYVADAGVNYGLGKMEQQLKANPNGFLPTNIGDPNDPDDANSLALSGSPYTAPTGFNFTYQPPGLTMIGDNAYSFTTVGFDPNNTGATATITATFKRKPAIQFGVFGDIKCDLGNTAAVYSFCHSIDPSPTPTSSSCPGEGDVGSNGHVILRNSSIVDGDVALGENPSGVDATLDDKGAIVTGINGDHIDRVDPGPLGVVGGDYAAYFVTYAANNDNSLAVSNTGQTIDASNTINLGSGGDLTLKGKSGGANYYIQDILLGNKSVLYIDTTSGPVSIYLTGEIDAVTGSEIVNIHAADCIDTGDGIICSCCDPDGTSPCGCCVWTPGLDCSACMSDPNGIGAPSDFRIFANSQSNTDKISIGNSVKFSGVIYAPYLTVRLDNSSDIFGAIIGKEVEVTNGVKIYFDLDTAKKVTTNDLILTTWRDVRN